MIDQYLAAVAGLANGELNTLQSFTPDIRSAAADSSKRHTPLVYCHSPWNADERFTIEVPEYVRVRISGEELHNDPFYYGREIGMLKGRVVRHPSLGKPVWTPCALGGIELNNPLQGGYVQRFKVIPRDRMIEIRVGITNHSKNMLDNMRTQLCSRSNFMKEFANPWPSASLLYSDGDTISWDGAGQDVDWVKSEYIGPMKGFSKSRFFLACVKGFESEDYLGKKFRDREDLMLLARTIDLPAIAKEDDSKRRHIVVYSPFGQAAFLNCRTPCFHADPEMWRIGPGETRWTVSYIIMFEGDIDALFKGLTEKHKGLKRQEGFVIEE